MSAEWTAHLTDARDQILDSRATPEETKEKEEEDAKRESEGKARDRENNRLRRERREQLERERREQLERENTVTISDVSDDDTSVVSEQGGQSAE